MDQSIFFIDNARKLIQGGEHPEFDLLDCCKVLLIIAGSDGDVSDLEWEVIFDFIDTVGGNLSIIDELQEFDFINSKLEDHIYRVDPDLYKILLYSSIRVARVDGLSNEEKEKARILARMTGIGESIAISIENLLNLEDEVKRLKDSLLS
jgi:hypothetical protein